MIDWEKFSKEFLAGYVKKMIESIEENADKKTKEKIFAETGRYCANAHTAEVFKRLKNESTNFNEFLKKINEELKGTTWEKIGRKTLKVTYNECYCPLISTGLYKTPIQCDCSIGWLKNNLEIVLGHPVKVELLQSILRNGTKCEFKIKI